MPQAMTKRWFVSGAGCFRAQVRRLLHADLAIILSLLIPLNTFAALQNRDANDAVVIGEIFVNRVNIFEPEEASEITAYSYVNKFHSTTKESTILRELDVSPGDRVSLDDVAEFERILRGLDLFSEVSVELRNSTENKHGNRSEDNADTDPSTAQLHIQTRDRLSIVAGASGSFLGGVGELGFTLGERNVYGRGDSFTLSYTGNTDNEIRGAIAYTDLHFINKDQRALYQVARTEEGDSYRMQFLRPFKNRQDRQSWSVLVESVERDIDYYEQGLSVVQVPEHKTALGLSKIWRSGSAERSLRRGLILQYKDLDYQASRGVFADTIEAPSDSVQYYSGFLVARDFSTEYRKVSGVDTMKFTQDLVLGSTLELQAGLSYTDYQSPDADNYTVKPKLSVSYTNALGVGENTLLRFGLSGSSTLRDIRSTSQNQGTQPWSVTASAKWYNTTINRHTFASRIDYTRAESNGALPTEYTLGEDNGLRGYAKRFLSGSERLRINFEDRMDFDWRLGFFDVGILGFFDIGWVADNSGEDELKRSAGVGLRLGSNVMFGANVIRVDLAVPFDDELQKHEPTVSVSLGQVFTY